MPKITAMACGPSNATCSCNCGKVDARSDEHLCEHDFQWPAQKEATSTVCTRCGLDAMTHSLWTGP